MKRGSKNYEKSRKKMDYFGDDNYNDGSLFADDRSKCYGG